MALPQSSPGALLTIGVAGVLERLEPLRPQIVKTLRNSIGKHASARKRGAQERGRQGSCGTRLAECSKTLLCDATGGLHSIYTST